MKRILSLLLLLPVTAFGTITVTNRGASSDNSTATTIVCNGRSGTLAVGSTGILVLASDNSNGATSNISSTDITDSVGNHWYMKTQGAGIAGANGATDLTVWVSAPLTHQLTTSDTVTVTFVASTPAKAWSFIEAAPTSGNMVIAAHPNMSADTGGTTLTNAPPDKVPSTGDLVVGMGASESPDQWTPDDTDTLNGSWTASQHAGVGTGATGMSVITQTKVVTGYGAQSFTITQSGASTDMRSGFLMLTEADPKSRSMGGNAVTTETTTPVFFQLPMAIGSAGVMWFVADNNGTGGNLANLPTAPVDSAGNTWTLQQDGWYDNGVAGAGIEFGLYTSILTHAVTAFDTMNITYTIAGVTAKSYGIWEFTPAGSGTMSYVTGGGAGSAGSTTASPTVTTGSIANGDYVIGLGAVEGPTTASNGWVQDSGTTNGTWHTAQIGGRGAVGTTAASGCSQWKKVTATATQTYSPTLGASQDTDIGWVQIHDSTTVGGFLLLFP